MPREQNRAAPDDLIYLVSCAVKESAPEKSRVEAVIAADVEKTLTELRKIGALEE